MPGAGQRRRAGRWPPAGRDRSRCVGFGLVRSRCASTIAPSAAVISSALVTSNGNTYVVKISLASPVTLSAPFAAVVGAAGPIAACPMTEDQQHEQADRGQPGGQPAGP